MSKQQEIRVGIAQWLYCQYRARHPLEYWTFDWNKVPEETKEQYRIHAKGLATYLDSQGVVIKVDRELPENCISYLTNKKGAIKSVWADKEKLSLIGYVATMPLVEE